MTVVQTDDLLSAAQQYLAAQSDLTALLGSDSTFDTWIFREELLAPVETTGKAALCLLQQGQWATPNDHNTLRFPVLTVEIYVDPPRDSEGNPTTTSVSSQIDHLFRVVDQYLHRPQGGEQLWGDLLTYGSLRASEPSRFPWADVDKTQVVRVAYNVNMG